MRGRMITGRTARRAARSATCFLPRSARLRKFSARTSRARPGTRTNNQTRIKAETRAEINFFKRFGDIVGMTLASEATLCMEQGIPYASICSVDNYCNGIGDKPLTVAQITGNAKKSMLAFERLVNALIQENGP